MTITNLMPQQELSINEVNGDKIQLKKIFLTAIKIKIILRMPIDTTYGHLLTYAHKYFTI
jgi:hypothetical protein